MPKNPSYLNVGNPCRIATDYPAFRGGGSVYTPPEGGDPVTDFIEITTDASATPTTSHIVLDGVQNAIRVFVGSTPDNEPYFHLYVRKNGGTARKVRMLRWSDIILRGYAGGDDLSFGTDDGRDIVVCAHTVGDTLTDPSGASGTVNCDANGPPLWEPEAPHIVLPDFCSSVTFEHTADIQLFIREYDGSSWSNIRYLPLLANVPYTYDCSHKEIAVANYSGTAISAVAPTGSTIGGVSVNASLDIDVPKTGSTLTVTAGSESDLRTKIANAQAGDEIVIPAGTYALTQQLLSTSFVSNTANVGPSGIIIRGETGDRDDVIIQPNTGTDQFYLNVSGGTLPFIIRDLTIRCDGTNSGVRIFAGKPRIQNVRIYGPQTGSLVYPLLHVGPTSTHPQDFKALDLLVEDSLDDGISGVASGASSQLANTSIVFIRSIVRRSGTTNDNMQCWTTHNNLPISLYGCIGSDARLNVIATGSESGSQFFTYFCTFTPGARRCGMRNSSYFGVTWTAGNQADDIRVKNGGNGYMILSKLTNSLMTSTNQITTFLGTSDNPQTGYVIGNRFTGSGTGRGIFLITGGAEIANNIITTCNEGIRNGNYASGSIGPSKVYNNTISGCVTAFSLSDATTTLQIYSNATRVSTTGINTTVGQEANTSHDYNTIDPTIDADFSAGANDIVSGDAAINTTTWFPAASGNCDDNGSPSYQDWIGGIDPYGFPLVYKESVYPRGARSNIQIRTDQAIHPGVRLSS